MRNAIPDSVPIYAQMLKSLELLDKFFDETPREELILNLNEEVSARGRRIVVLPPRRDRSAQPGDCFPQL